MTQAVQNVVVTFDEVEATLLNLAWEAQVRQDARDHFINNEGMTPDEVSERVTFGKIRILQTVGEGADGEVFTCITGIEVDASVRANLG